MADLADNVAPDQRLLERFARVRQLLEEQGQQAVGDRVRRLRQQQGLSIRELAERAGLNKNSIVRLEQGRGSSPMSIIRVCAAFQIHIGRLFAEDGSEVSVAFPHHHRDDQWCDLRDLASPAADSPDGLDVGAVAASILQSRIPDGRLRASILVLTEATEPRSHRGEEFVYVLDGALHMTIAGVDHHLAAGESIAFHSAETHTYAPRKKGEQVRLLSVRVEGV